MDTCHRLFFVFHLSRTTRIGRRQKKGCHSLWTPLLLLEENTLSPTNPALLHIYAVDAPVQPQISLDYMREYDKFKNISAKGTYYVRTLTHVFLCT